jgi:hypothetical protein
MKNAFSAPSFKDVVPDPDNATTGLDAPQTFTIETFEGFTYVVDVGNATEDGDFYLTVETTAEFPTDYVPEPEAEEEEGAAEDGAEADAGEAEAAEAAAEAAPAEAEATDGAELSAEEKAKKEEEEKAKKEEEAKKKKEDFEKEVERKQEKLETEKAYAGYVYLVNKWSVDSLLKNRADLLRPDEEPVPAGGDPANPTPTAVTPPVAVPPPAGGTATRPRITAVTPPIEVPIPPKEGEEKDGEKKEGEKAEEETPGEAEGDDGAAEAPGGEG